MTRFVAVYNFLSFVTIPNSSSRVCVRMHQLAWHCARSIESGKVMYLWNAAISGNKTNQYFESVCQHNKTKNRCVPAQ